MIKKYLKSFTVIFYSILFVLNCGAVFAHSQYDKYHADVKAGIEKAFNMEISHANDYLQKAVELDPENPTGYAFLAMINLFAYDMSYNENEAENRQDSLLNYVNETIIRGEKKISENPKDSNAYLAMAIARTVRLNWYIRKKKESIHLAHETSVTWDSIKKAQEYNPQNYDTYFLTGLFRYHIDHFPGLPRFFASLLITSGDRQKGLQEIKLASQKGDLLKLPALLELFSVYSNFEKQPTRALSIISKFKKDFPDNYNFYFALANVHSDLHRFDDAFNIAGEIENNIRSGISPFIPQLQPRYDQLMGRIFLTAGNYTKAEEYLQKALKDKTRFNARVRAWAYVRLGMISDARKEREKAENYYSKVKEIKEGEGVARIEARKYLKNPYVPPIQEAEKPAAAPNGNGIKKN
ncbi:MAG: hypothetical protein ABFD50_00965 [Smithella sp.]